MRELAPDGKDRRFYLFDVSQGLEHLLGAFALERQTERTERLVLQGHMDKDGAFAPNVSLEVSDHDDGPWTTVESSFSDKVDLSLTGAPHVDKLYVRFPLDAFQGYIGKFKFCRVALQSGEADVFPMGWLTPEGK